MAAEGREQLVGRPSFRLEENTGWSGRLAVVASGTFTSESTLPTARWVPKIGYKSCSFYQNINKVSWFSVFNGSYIICSTISLAK